MKNAALLFLFLFVFACKPKQEVPAGNAERGRQLITQYGCNVCHITPGISGPQGVIGPSLAGVASRPMLSNNAFRNTPETVAKFLQTPASMNPASSMPPLGIGPIDTQDIAAYLAMLK
jgi:cytochrome c2